MAEGRKNPPEEVADESLDTAQGGELVIELRRQTGQASVHVNAGGGWDHTLKQPTMRM